jgi:hypothetical protein
MPTGRLNTHHQWPSLTELPQAFFLPGSPLRAAPAAMVRDQAVHATPHQGLLPVLETGRAEAPTLTQHRHGDVVHKEVNQHGGAPHQAHIIFPIGVLKTAVKGFDGGGTALYPDTHGCILPSSCEAIVL